MYELLWMFSFKQICIPLAKADHDDGINFSYPGVTRPLGWGHESQITHLCLQLESRV